MTAASRKTPFAVMAFLALAVPSAGEGPGPENDYGRPLQGQRDQALSLVSANPPEAGLDAAMDLIDKRMPPGLEARFGN